MLNGTLLQTNVFVILDSQLLAKLVFASRESHFNISVIDALIDLILNGGSESANVKLDIPSMELNVFQIRTMAKTKLLIVQLELSSTPNRRNAWHVLPAV